MDQLYRSRSEAKATDLPPDATPAVRRARPTARAENERALLEAAEQIFAELGFAGATTAAIARKAGVPKANLH